MKIRILSACVALVVLSVVLAFFDTWVLNAAISLISALAVLEVFHAANYHKNTLLLVGALLFSILIPFFKTGFILHILPMICFIYILMLFLVLLKNHTTMHIEQVAFMFFFSIVIPFSLTTAIYIRDTVGLVSGFYYTAFALASAWVADTGAYFCGVKFGKHKLAPLISPKKTIEGAVGGVVFALIFVLIFSWGYSHGVAEFTGIALKVNYIAIALVSPLLTVVSILGDLSASVIKRQYGVKDFGSIMPGHGGVMDRFDSVLFVIPAVYIISRFIPLICM